MYECDCAFIGSLLQESDDDPAAMVKKISQVEPYFVVCELEADRCFCWRTTKCSWK